MTHLRETLPGACILEHEPMAMHTTFKIGGPADLYVKARGAADVRRALEYARTANMPHLIIGNGSNLLVSDEGFRGLVIELGEGMCAISVSGHTVTAQAGARLSALAREAMRCGLTGLEFASGIPGCVGGGTAMNAGAYGGQLSDVLTRVTLLEDGEVVDVPASQMAFGYRESRALSKGSVVLESAFALSEGDPAEIQAKMNDLNARRREKQPLSYPSAGSVFKRPEGYFAGALIEGAGLKGARVGGASVSELHAGFIISDGTATARDVRELIELIRERVFRQYGVQLETEIRFVGF